MERAVWVAEAEAEEGREVVRKRQGGNDSEHGNLEWRSGWVTSSKLACPERQKKLGLGELLQGGAGWAGGEQVAALVS